MPPVLQELCPEADTQGSHDCPLRHQALQMQGASQHDLHYDNPTKPKVRYYNASLTLITWGIRKISKGQDQVKSSVSR